MTTLIDNARRQNSDGPHAPRELTIEPIGCDCFHRPCKCDAATRRTLADAPARGVRVTIPTTIGHHDNQGSESVASPREGTHGATGEPASTSPRGDADASSCLNAGASSPARLAAFSVGAGSPAPTFLSCGGDLSSVAVRAALPTEARARAHNPTASSRAAADHGPLLREGSHL